MPKNMSFLPEDYVEKRVARRTATVCVILFAVMLLALVGTYFVRRGQFTAALAQHAQVNQRMEEAARQLEQLEKLQQRKSQMMQKAAITSVLVERVPRSLVLSEMINHMPQQLSLLEMDLETEVVRTSPQPRTSLQREKSRLKKTKQDETQPRLDAPETRVKINLVGVAPTDLEVSQFIGALNRHELFEKVNLQFSEQMEIEQRRMRKFRVQFELNQSIDTQQFQPTKVARELKQDPMSGEVTIQPPATPQANQ